MSHGILAKTLVSLPKQELPTFQIPKSGLFVKINMDGIPIGRKIDLAAYKSYEKLSSAIDDLFRDLLAGLLILCKTHYNVKKIHTSHQTDPFLQPEDSLQQSKL